MAHEVEGVGGDAVHPVVGPVHHKLNAPGNGAELADDQLVPKRGVVEEDVALLKLRGVFQVVVIGVVPHVDVGGGDDVFQETGRLVFVGKDRVGVWNVKHVLFLLGVVGWHHFLSVGFAVATAFLVRRYCMESSLLEKMKVEKRVKKRRRCPLEIDKGFRLARSGQHLADRFEHSRSRIPLCNADNLNFGSRQIRSREGFPRHW